jgi:general secretion pathway protein K
MAMREPNFRLRTSARDGFIIVAVLWVLIALATLASIYSIYVGNSALALSVMDDGLQTEALVSASVELTAYRLTVPTKERRPTRGGFSFRLDRANVAVNFSSETARIDLNAAPKSLLAGLFAALGASNDNADQYADRIIGWRTTPNSASQGAEAALYRAAGLLYIPRGAPFAHVNELWLVQGLPPALVGLATPFLTVYSGRPEINVFDAPPPVIAALPGMTPARLNSFLARRETASPEPESLPQLLGSDQPNTTAEGSSAFRLRIHIAFDNGSQTEAEVVILLDATDEPFHVLSWSNDIDANPNQPHFAARLR